MCTYGLRFNTSKQHMYYISIVNTFDDTSTKGGKMYVNKNILSFDTFRGMGKTETYTQV